MRGKRIPKKTLIIVSMFLPLKVIEHSVLTGLMTIQQYKYIKITKLYILMNEVYVM